MTWRWNRWGWSGRQLPLQPEEPQGTHPRWRSLKPWSAGPPVTGATDVKCPMVMYIISWSMISWLHNNQPMFIGLTGRMHVCIQRKSSGLCVFFLLGPGQLNQYLSDTAGVYKGYFMYTACIHVTYCIAILCTNQAKVPSTFWHPQDLGDVPISLHALSGQSRCPLGLNHCHEAATIGLGSSNLSCMKWNRCSQDSDGLQEHLSTPPCCLFPMVRSVWDRVKENSNLRADHKFMCFWYWTNCMNM